VQKQEAGTADKRMSKDSRGSSLEVHVRTGGFPANRFGDRRVLRRMFFLQSAGRAIYSHRLDGE
jgi:hypothetical protein